MRLCWVLSPVGQALGLSPYTTAEEPAGWGREHRLGEPEDSGGASSWPLSEHDLPSAFRPCTRRALAKAELSPRASP